MNNHVQITALLAQVSPIRYTPAGVPVLEIMLQHESWQEENGLRYLAKLSLPAKLLGDLAYVWQHKQGEMVFITGILVQTSQKNTRPMLRIQQIQEYKG